MTNTTGEKRNVTKLAVALQRYQRSEFGREIVAHAQEPQIKCTCTTGGAKWFRRDSCIKASMIALTLKYAGTGNFDMNFFYNVAFYGSTRCQARKC